MEHMQLVIKNPERAFHTFAMPESTASSAHTIFVCPPSGNRIEVTIPPGKLPGDLFTQKHNHGPKTLFTQKHNPGKTHKLRQSRKGETASTVRSQRWVPGRMR